MSPTLNGMGVYVIAKALNQKGIPTIRGAEKWQDRGDTGHSEKSHL